MATTPLDLGTTPDDGTGTDGRAGGQIINDNFALYDAHVIAYDAFVASLGTMAAEDAADYVEIAGDTMTGTLEVDATNNVNKVKLRANASQTLDIFQTFNSAGTKRARVTKDGEFSNAAATVAEQFGVGATATGYSTAAFGNGATATQTFATAMGGSAQATGFNTLALGFNAIASGSGATALGAACTASAQNTFAMGTGANAAHTSCVVIGSAGSTTTYQLIFGNSIKDVYFGGVTLAATSPISLNAPGGSGTDKAGADLTVAGGQGTGTGIGGDLIFKTAPPGTTGTALNALVEHMRITDDGETHFSTGQLIPTLGTTTVAPVHFQDGTLKTTPVAGDMEYSNNHWYITDGARHVIVSSEGVKTSTTTVVNTVTETQVYAYTFAAGELHLDERIIFDMNGAYSNDSASDDFTIRFKVGGATIATVGRAGGNVTNAGWQAIFEGTIRTAGAAGKFVYYAKFNDGTTDYGLASTTEQNIDTTGTVLFEVTVQWDNAKAGNTFSATQGDLMFRH